MNYYNNGSTGMIRDSYTDEGRANEEAAHSARMRSAADANVEVFTDTRGTPSVAVNSQNLEGETRGDRVTDSLKITAGGTEAFNTLFAYAEQRGDHALISQWNAAVQEAVQGDSAVKRHNAHSRAEAILMGLKRSYARANQSKDAGPQIDIIR